MTGGKIPNFLSKRMLRYFLKSPPLKEILQFQTRICFFIKNTQKITNLQQVSGGETPNPVPTKKKILEFQNQKRSYETCTKKQFQTKIETNV